MRSDKPQLGSKEVLCNAHYMMEQSDATRNTHCKPVNSSHDASLTNDSLYEAELPYHQGSRVRSMIPGCSVLSLPATFPKPSRANYEPPRRKEVATIRRLGACLRCHSRKISCSTTTPCKPCNKKGISCRRKDQDVREIDPVPLSFKTVDIFSMGQACSKEEYLEHFRKSDLSFEGNASHDYESIVEWNTQVISADCIAWLCGNEPSASYSRSWLFSSFKTERLLSSLLDRTICQSLRLLTETTSIIHNWGQDTSFADCSATKLGAIRAYAGSQTIQALEVELNPTKLSHNSVEQLRGLFLLIFGTMLAVSFSESKVDPVLPEHADPFQRYNESRCHRNHVSMSSKRHSKLTGARTLLLRALIHHMVNLAERTLEVQALVAEDLLHEACDRWGSKGIADFTIDPERPAPITKPFLLNQEVAEPRTSNNTFYTLDLRPSHPSPGQQSQQSQQSRFNVLTDPRKSLRQDPERDSIDWGNIYSSLALNHLVDNWRNPCSIEPTSIPSDISADSPKLSSDDMLKKAQRRYDSIPTVESASFVTRNSPRILSSYPELTTSTSPRQDLDRAQSDYGSTPTVEPANFFPGNSQRMLGSYPELAAPASPQDLGSRSQATSCAHCNSNLDSDGLCDSCVQSLFDFENYLDDTAFPPEHE